MPLFEYECQQCKHQFEALVVGSKKPVCPKCQGDQLEKRVSRPGLSGVGYGGWSRSKAGCGTTSGGG